MQRSGLLHKRRCCFAKSCGEVEDCTSVVSQHREQPAAHSVTTSSLLLSLSTPSQAFQTPVCSKHNSIDLLLYRDENADFLLWAVVESHVKAKFLTKAFNLEEFSSTHNVLIMIPSCRTYTFTGKTRYVSNPPASVQLYQRDPFSFAHWKKSSPKRPSF